MAPFSYYHPTRIHFGSGALSLVGKEAKKLGRRPLVVVGKNWAMESGLLLKLNSLLREEDLSPSVFQGVESNPRVDTVDRASLFFLDAGSDFVISMGGGSVMDAGKAIAVVVGSGGGAWDYISIGPKRSRTIRKAYPVLTIPTTLGTGSEADSVSVISNPETREKMPLSHPLMYPAIALVDPTLTLSLSERLTAMGVLDMFTHVLEPYISAREGFYVSDRIAETLLLSIMEKGKRALSDGRDLEARENLCWLSLLSMWKIHKIGRPSPFSMHYIEHVVSGYTDCPHAEGLAALLVPWLKWLIEEGKERMARLGEVLFKISDPQGFINGIEQFIEVLGLKTSLWDLGVRKEELGNMARDVLRLYPFHEGKLPGPRPLDVSDVMGVLEEAFYRGKEGDERGSAISSDR